MCTKGRKKRKVITGDSSNCLAQAADMKEGEGEREVQGGAIYVCTQ